MMGSGKSGHGQKLAKLLKFDFVDTDALIETSQRLTVSEIFERKGEDYFRQLEHELLLDFSSPSNSVIATGGGFPCFGNNMDLMNSIGSTVYLKADAAFLASRLQTQKSKRPLIAQLSGNDLVAYLKNLLQARESFYLKSKVVLETKNLKTIQIVDRLVSNGLFIDNFELNKD